MTLNRNNKQVINIMLVDDHLLVLDGLYARLDLEDYINIVGTANNGLEALEKAKELKPDVVLMDVSMPVLNGLEAAKRFNAEQPNTKILMLSMHHDREYILSLLQSGASGYVLKDVSVNELITAIETVYQGGTYFSAGASQSLFVAVEKESDTQAEALTKRETDVLVELASGRANKEVARSLNISVRTVETHRQNIKNKLNIHTTAGLTKYAIDKGLA
ncbi:response regulator transcription factor [Marinomonas mediterranea]|jgi:transcriptional regulator, LuxR family|uniref:Two component transcriptional regulator, LuxR family n=1 Tax=Marinomonas mediterranea (strain ATCC 700492 / JCM 21426 / NBRC 103028 / MMB-1) TaxID=717774 RepID=F2K0C1_MARM1|nr:response regulator transcription factor [Marinomonas mediterranea]ADZ89836.1 two component transcriptional regulator, LuxR family [Marinomonas mediterranea MMB-1]WCN07924.1 response regulator [Marinomonas mediterranea]WCN12019.1 response regulator [Marinomonas mediterranea]WCN16056.1 response regulator [Marinomonas mediterranea MMB-1]